MKRDPRLAGLSSQHHQALLMGQRLAGAVAWTAEDGASLARWAATELEPHFAIEDDVLLPALRASGRPELIALAERTADDHAFVRAQLALARGGELAAARAMGERLRTHVRFEERELFPACEAALAAEVLDEVARRAPW